MIDDQDATDPAEEFRATLAAAIKQAPAGTPGRWQDDQGVTVEVTGASRARQTWPQPTAQITITTPDGATSTHTGDGVASWADLWDLVQDAAHSWGSEVERHLHAAVTLQRQLDQLEHQATQVRARRNLVIRAAKRAGASNYRIAQQTGLRQPSVADVLKVTGG